MKTLLEQLKEAAEAGQKEFKKSREKSGRTFKDDKDEMINEFKQFAKQGHQQMSEAHNKARKSIESKFNQYKELSKKEECDFPYCDCEDECKKDSGYSYEKEYEHGDESSMFKDITSFLLGEEKAELIDLLNKVQGVRNQLAEDALTGAESTKDVKNVVFILTLLETTFEEFILSDDDYEQDALAQDISEFSEELGNYAEDMESEELDELVYALHLLF